MLYRMSMPIVDRQGLTIKGAPQTVGDAIILALDSSVSDPQERESRPGAKVERFNLASRIHGNITLGDNLTDLKIEEVALIRRIVEAAYVPLVAGQVWAALEEPAQKPDAAAA